MAPRKLSDSDKSDIIELYRQPNQTTSTLASQYGVSNSTVSRILKLSLPPEEYSELIAQKRMAGSTDKAGATDKAEPTAKRQAAKSKTVKSKTAKTKTTKAKAAKDEPAGRKVRKRTSRKSVEAAEETSEVPIESVASASPKLKSAAQQDEDTATDKSAQKSAQKSVKEPAKKSSGTRRRRSRSRKTVDDDEQLPLLATEAVEDESDTAEADTAEAAPTFAPPKLVSAQSAASDEEDDEDDDDPLAGLDDTLGDEFGDDDLDEEEEDDEDEGDVIDVPKPKLSTKTTMAIMPLGEAILPKPCYLVVDMRSELITRPLSDFAKIGKVPSSEEKSKTLPVFDNHRVARRFSRNKQRVIKVPDGDLITRTSPYLKAKGITRLLVDGQVFDV